MSRRNTYFIAQTLDSDAMAYIATGITDATEKSAINQFFLDLKSYSIYSKFYHLHLLVAGSATTRKFNIVNPLDTNAAFRLSFVNSWTHASTGSTPNIVNGYADSFLVPATTVNLNDVGVSIYSDTNTDDVVYDFGCTDGTNRFESIIRFGNAMYGLLNQTGTSTVTNTNSQGLFTISRTASNLTTIYRNGSSIGTHADASTARPSTYSNYLGARNAVGSPSLHSGRRYRVFGVHTSFTATQAANFNTAVQTLMTALGI